MSVRLPYYHSPLPEDYAEKKATMLWERAQTILNDSLLMQERGFAGSSVEVPVVMAITVGDRLHPTLGLDFLGVDWILIEEHERQRLLNERDAAVDAIAKAAIDTLVSEGFDNAQRVAKAASPYQVVYLARSVQDTRAVLQLLCDVGLGANELSDWDWGKRGEYLYIQWKEYWSYFVPGDYGY